MPTGMWKGLRRNWKGSLRGTEGAVADLALLNSCIAADLLHIVFTGQITTFFNYLRFDSCFMHIQSSTIQFFFLFRVTRKPVNMATAKAANLCGVGIE